MAHTYSHPNPGLNKAVNYGALIVFSVMIVSIIPQVYIALTLPLGRMMMLAALFTLGLALPVLMLTTLYPAVTVEQNGLLIQPVIWKPVRVAWSDIRAVKHHPLLPPPDSEVGRKLMIGRKKYQPAEGIMLVIPSLPFYYTVNGLFCGEGLTTVVAFTNRSHTEYRQLHRSIEQHVEQQFFA